MDKYMLELFARLLSSQQNLNINSTGNNAFQSNNTNPAYANYPSEAFAQSVNSQSTSQSSSNFLNNNLFSQTNNLSTLSNLLSGNGDNNLLPLLLSILGKNSNGLSSIFEAPSAKKQSSEEESNNEKTGNFLPIDDEILL